MPNITEYNAPIDQVRPDEQAAGVAREAGAMQNKFGREAGESLGGAIARVGGQIGTMLDDHVASTMISQGAASYASMFSDLTQQWNNTAAHADPNDSSIMAGFTEHVLQPTLDKFTSAFDGAPEKAKNWAQERANSLQQHFTQKMIADSGTRAGIAVQKNVDDMTRDFSNTVANDPTALDHISDAVKGSVDALVSSNPFLTPDEQARVKDELVPKMMKKIGQSAFYGVAKTDPDEAKAALARGDFNQYMDAEEQIKAGHFADEVKRGKVTDQLRQHELDQIQKKDAEEKAANGYISGILTGKPPTAAQIAADPNLSPAQRENLVNFQFEHTRQLREKTENTPHPQVFRSLLNGLFDKAQKDPNNLNVQPIRDAFNRGELNPREEAELETRFNALDKPMEKNYQGQLKTVERSLGQNMLIKGMGDADPSLVPSILNNIDRDAYAKLNKVRNEGGDVNPLLDPKSKDYLFSKPVIDSYVREATGGLSGMAEKVKSGVEAGTIKNGYKFKGGDPADKANWEKV